MDEGREKGTRKGQMAPSSSQPSGSGHAPTESKHLPLLPRRRAQENHRLLSSCQGKRPILRPTPTASRSRGALPGPVSYFVSFPSVSPPPRSLAPPCPSPSPFIATSVSFIPPAGTAARAPRFSILADGTCRAEGSAPLLSSHFPCRSFVEPDKTARTRQINWERTSAISSVRSVPRTRWSERIFSSS